MTASTSPCPRAPRSRRPTMASSPMPADELKGYGKLVLIRHPNGFVSAYANNERTRGQARRYGQARPDHRQIRRDRQCRFAAIALRIAQGFDAGRSDALSRRPLNAGRLVQPRPEAPTGDREKRFVAPAAGPKKGLPPFFRRLVFAHPIFLPSRPARSWIIARRCGRSVSRASSPIRAIRASIVPRSSREPEVVGIAEDHGEIVVLAAMVKAEPEPETVGKRNLLLDRVAGVDGGRAFVLHHVARQEVAAVRSGVEDDIARPSFDAAFEGRLQRFIGRIVARRRRGRRRK